MSDLNAGKEKRRGFWLLSCACVISLGIWGFVFFINNASYGDQWLKKNGLGIEIDDVDIETDGWFGMEVKDTLSDIEVCTFSSVSLLRREYKRSHKDLSVKVQGGKIVVRKSYHGNKWDLGPSRKDMSSPNKADLKAFKKGNEMEIDGVRYYAKGENTWKYGLEAQIKKEKAGYRWENNKSKEWKKYDEFGRMTSYGTQFGTLGRVLYEPETYRIRGYADRNDNQVIWYEYNEEGFVSAIYDRENRRVEYSYTDGLLTTVTDVLGYQTLFEYDDMGRLVRTIDPAGRESIVTYNEYGAVSSNVDGNGIGYFFEFDYDEETDEYYAKIEYTSGMVKEIWCDEHGKIRQVDVNGRTKKAVEREGRTLFITNESGYVTRKEVDERMNLTRTVYPDGSEVSFDYDDKFHKVIRKVDEAGVVTEYEYDKEGKPTTKIEASGTDVERITEYLYDDAGNLLSVKTVGDANTAETITTMTYDEYGNKTSMTDPEGNTTYYTHDIMGNVLTRTNAKGKVWTYEYDAKGKQTSYTDPLNNRIEIFYDEVGNKIQEIDPNGSAIFYEYDDNGNLRKRIDTSGKITLFEYDNACRKLNKVIDPEGHEIRYIFDSECRLVKTIDGNGNEIVMEYDAVGCSSCPGGGSNQASKIIYPTFAKEYTYDIRGRKTEERDVLSDTVSYLTEFVYDLSGNLLSFKDKEGQITSYEYDELDRLLNVIDPINGVTSYTYDNRDNLIALTDSEDNTTLFEYDGNNRLVKEIRPMGEETTYTYDEIGNLVQKIDAKGQKIENQYDDIGRQEEVRYFSSVDHVNPVKVVSFTYDKLGNLKSYDDGTTSALYEYDDGSRKTSEMVNYGPFSKTNTYTYYQTWRKKTFTGPDGVVYHYSYDANNQLTELRIANEGKMTFSEYTWRNEPKAVNLPGGITKEYTYDPLMRVESITSAAPGGKGSGRGRGKSKDLLLNYQYTYDKMDNITAKQTEHGGYDYSYDDLYRLTKAESPMLKAESFTYDAVGNRLTSADTTGDWAYNLNNELERYDNVSYVYDDNGNMVQKTVDGVVTNYIYNVEDRLSEVRDGSGSLIASYYYDPNGRRLWKEVDGVRTYFHYADEGLVGEFDATGYEIKTYVYKPRSRWTTDPLLMKQDNQYYFFHNDHLGTPQKITAANGAVVWSAKYRSFGEATVDAVSAITNNLRFPGQYYDEETGLHNNLFRYYNPSEGRYLRLDPLRDKAFLSRYAQQQNIPSIRNMTEPVIYPYVYVLSNPLNGFDSNGLYQTPLSPSELQQCLSLMPTAHIIAENALEYIPCCASHFDNHSPRCLGESGLEALNSMTVEIDNTSNHPSNRAGYCYPDEIREMWLAPLGCRMGQWTMAATMLHELYHECDPYASEFEIENVVKYGCEFST